MPDLVSFWAVFVKAVVVVLEAGVHFWIIAAQKKQVIVMRVLDLIMIITHTNIARIILTLVSMGAHAQ